MRVKPVLSGICGSDLSTLAGRSSFYFSPLVSTPFVPGHEVVGELLDAVDDIPVGGRVVLSSVLGCEARGEDPLCPNCAAGDVGRCDRVTVGHLKPGLQTGYCAQTGGGWSRQFVAHRSQLHAVPDATSDEAAVLIEPFACAIHAALRARIEPGQTVVIVGAGTVGILTLIAVRLLTQPGQVIVAAKHPKQRAAARLAGADEVVLPAHTAKAVRRVSERGEAHAGARPGLPARRRRRGDRVHRLSRRSRSGAADGPGRRPRRRERHPRRRRGPHAAVVPRARAGRRVHLRHGDHARRIARADVRSGARRGREPPGARAAGRGHVSAATGGARRSTTRCPPGSSARSRWRSRRRD